MDAEIHDLTSRLDGRRSNSKQFDAIVSSVTSSIGNPTPRQKRLIEAYATAAINVDALNLRLLQGDDVPQGDFSNALGIMMRLDEALFETKGDENEQPVLHPQTV